MSRFTSVIEAARKGSASAEAPPAAQVEASDVTHDHGNLANLEAIKPGISGPVNKGIGEAVNTENRERIITPSHKNGNKETPFPMNMGTHRPVKTSNLTVTIPTTHRHYWVGEARKRGTTVTAVIVEALTAALGKPDQ